ncbi:contact-dependent growth inhibition system immunity protein [Streptomyces sp. NPDC046465]|uniref:contact-dependent growth inhibition system immunity protein n=1 Tax=Streptomyces sp. NPDC046465 TaxID=3155810 RepID=UPI0033C6C3DF
MDRGLVGLVRELRRRPVGTLEPHELARLIGQDVGLPWLLPLAVEILRDSAPQQAGAAGSTTTCCTRLSPGSRRSGPPPPNSPASSATPWPS